MAPRCLTSKGRARNDLAAECDRRSGWRRLFRLGLAFGRFREYEWEKKRRLKDSIISGLRVDRGKSEDIPDPPAPQGFNYTEEDTDVPFKPAVPTRSKTDKPRNPVRLMAKANVREVNWARDIPAGMNVPAYVKDKLDAASILHNDVRRQLDVARRERGKGAPTVEVKIPNDLQAGIPMSDAGVRQVAGPSEE